MQELFQIIRFPVTVALGLLLTAGLPVWFAAGFAFGCLFLMLGVGSLPLVLVAHAFKGDVEGFRRYVRGLFDFDRYWTEWWQVYVKRWTDLATWQRTGR